MAIKVGRLRGNKTEYRGEEMCCVWFPLNGKDDDLGICFDFLPEDIDDFIALLQKLKEMEAKQISGSVA